MRLWSYGRYALARWVQERGVSQGVLYVPSYICVEAVEPLESMGQRLCFYPVLDSLEPDWAWLESQVHDEGKALLLVHYFGFPNNIEKAIEFCQRRGLFLMEDCAHSFLSRYRGQTIGTFGDVGFYSFYKMLPIPAGAGLVEKEGTPGRAWNGEVPGLPYREVGRRLASSLLHRLGISAGPWRWLQAGYARTAGGATRVSDSPMDGMSRRLMKMLEPHLGAIEARRRENYSYLAKAFRAFSQIRPLYPELPEGVCPYGFPLLVADRDRLVERLRARGVPAQGWPTLPRVVAEDPGFEMSRRYASELMVLPVHQDLDSQRMNRILWAYREASQAVGVGP